MGEQSPDTEQARSPEEAPHDARFLQAGVVVASVSFLLLLIAIACAWVSVVSYLDAESTRTRLELIRSQVPVFFQGPLYDAKGDLRMLRATARAALFSFLLVGLLSGSGLAVGACLLNPRPREKRAWLLPFVPPAIAVGVLALLGGAPYLLLLPEPEGKYRVAGIRVEISSEDFVEKDGAGKHAPPDLYVVVTQNDTVVADTRKWQPIEESYSITFKGSFEIDWRRKDRIVFEVRDDEFVAWETLLRAGGASSRRFPLNARYQTEGGSFVEFKAERVLSGRKEPAKAPPQANATEQGPDVAVRRQTAGTDTEQTGAEPGTYVRDLTTKVAWGLAVGAGGLIVFYLRGLLQKSQKRKEEEVARSKRFAMLLTSLLERFTRAFSECARCLGVRRSNTFIESSALEGAAASATEEFSSVCDDRALVECVLRLKETFGLVVKRLSELRKAQMEIAEGGKVILGGKAHFKLRAHQNALATSILGSGDQTSRQMADDMQSLLRAAEGLAQADHGRLTEMRESLSQAQGRMRELAEGE